MSMLPELRIRCCFAIAVLAIAASRTALAAEAVVTLVDGSTREGRLAALDLTLLRLNVGGDVAEIPLKGVRCIQLDNASGGSTASQPFRISLSSSDELSVNELNLRDDVLTIASPAFGETELTIDAVQSLFLNGAGEGTGPVESRLPSENVDVVLLENGDLIRGSIVRITATELAMETTLGSVSVDRKRVRQVAMNKDLLSRWPSGEAPYFLIEFLNGDWCTAAACSTKAGDVFKVKHVLGAEFDVPASNLKRVSTYGYGVISLADRQPIASSGAAYFGQPVEVKTNFDEHGGTLDVAGERFRRGIGMTSQSQVTFAILPGDQVFQTGVGLDDDVRTAAGVDVGTEVRVLVDGQVAWSGGILRPGDGLRQSPRIPLAGKRKLSLLVDYGTGADIQDLVNWCDPVIIRD